MFFATSDVDFSTQIGGVYDKLSEAVNANTGAVLAIFGFMTAISVVFWLIKRVTSGNV